MEAWRGTCEENNVLPFRTVAEFSEVPTHLVRRVVRALARKGMVEFCQMSWNDEGPCGAGYMPTEAGYEYLDGSAK